MAFRLIGLISGPPGRRNVNPSFHDFRKSRRFQASLAILGVIFSLVLCRSLGDLLGDLQSPPKESIHFCRAEYSKLRGARCEVGGAPKPTIELVQTGPSLILKFKERAAYQQFSFLCHHLLEFKNEA